MISFSLRTVRFSPKKSHLEFCSEALTVAFLRVIVVVRNEGTERRDFRSARNASGCTTCPR